MTQEQQNIALDRIKVLDSYFAESSCWGSWMVECANEREALVNRLNKNGHTIEHKYQARTGSGGRVS